MIMEFERDPAVKYLDMQYMLGINAGLAGAGDFMKKAGRVFLLSSGRNLDPSHFWREKSGKPMA